MTRKKDEASFLIIPKLHHKFNDEKIEQALLAKSREFIGAGEQELNYLLISGNFFDTRGWAYSSIRSWRGAIRPGESTRKKPMLDATFACLSVYLSSLISFQADYNFAYDEIKKILLDQERDDLWSIIEEKLPFVSLPPQEMFPPGLKSPIAPYFTIKQDEELFLGELYPSVFLSNVVENLKSRFFIFFSYEGNNAFGFFNQLPIAANFGFNEPTKPFTEEPTTDNIVKYIESATSLKDLLVALMQSHNNSLLEQYLVDDYESFLNRLLEIEEVDEGEG